MVRQALVSIVIPAYNSADFIRETLDSCLAQTYKHIELIVIDDGSSDETVEIMQSYGDKVHLIQQRNSGPAIARNTGIANAAGEYIQFCDSDDVLDPQKIERSMAIMLDKPDVALVYSQMQAVDEEGQILSSMSPVPDESFLTVNNLFCTILQANGSPIQTSTILVRKSALETVGKYRADPDHICAEDWDLLLRLAGKFQFAGISETLVKYRLRRGALSTKTLSMAEGRLKTIQYARHYASRQNCIDDKAYDRLEAGRHHSLAMTLWQVNRRNEARTHLKIAIELTEQSRIIRRIAWASSYFLDFQTFDKLLGIIAG